MSPSATFDVLGTCFHFTPAITRISEILSRINPSPSSSSTQSTLLASALFHTWFYASQRDFTYLSLSKSYTPILSIFTGTFRRACHVIGLDGTKVSDDDVTGLMEIMKSLPAREGLKECFEILRADGWDVVACTNGGRKGTEGYFSKAGVQGVEGGNVISCDEIEGGVAKPDLRVYREANRVLDEREKAGKGQGGGGESGKGNGNTRWFVAAHSWDLIAARKAGFRTAWVSHEEGDVCGELFGEFDVYAKGLKECAEAMVKVEKEGK